MTEIETLYEIIGHAQTLPGPPLRALFTAYDRAKKDGNIQDDGERLLGFLLRMVEDGEEKRRAARGRERRDRQEGHGEVGLMERFQQVLGRMGISVEVEDGETEGLGLGSGANMGLRGERGEEMGERRRDRTGSFDSFLDGVADKVPGELPFRSRRGSGAASDTGMVEKRRSTSASGTGSRALGRLPIRTIGINGNRTRRTASDNIGSRPRRSASVSSRASLRIYRDGDTGTQQLGDYDGDDSDQTDSFDRSNIQIPGVNAPLPEAAYGQAQDYAAPEMLYRPSDTQIVRDAETFDHHRLLVRARTYLQNWRDLARDATAQREQMEAKAAAFQRNVLLPASFDSWRTGLESRHQVLETERFFERLETRAGKARNLFLLTKAFTHWAKSAEDEVQRTSTARRHLLRTRYFNAWRDITAVNELKIQHFILAKFLEKWRHRTAAVQEQSDMAVGLYEHNVVYRLYWQWFWRFADCRAPFLYRNRLMRNTFVRWAEIVGILKEREGWAVDQRDRTIARKALTKLQERALKTRDLEETANEFQHSALLASGFVALRRRAQFTPLEAQVKTRIDARLLRSAFQGWRRDTRLSRQAREVDRMRVIRNGFTGWNDRLRIKAVEDRINDRLQLECMYKWTLASRVSLFQRIHNHRLKHSIFTRWAAKCQDQELTLEDAQQRFATFKRRQMLRSCLGKIEAGTVERRSQEYLARSVHEPKLKQIMFDKIIAKHEHIQQLDDWADRANYYVTTKNALKRWRTATEFARRNRRRETYAQVRRMVKMNLVRRTFSTWRDKAATLTTQQRQADEMVENRLLQISAVMLGRWHHHSATYSELNAQATQTFKVKITAFALTKLTDKTRVLQDKDAQALAYRQESTDIVATSCLKKLGWKLWNVRRREEDALALHQRNFEKHLRAMIRFWQEQTNERLAERPTSPTPSSRARVGRRRDDDNDNDNDEEGGGEENQQNEDLYGESDTGTSALLNEAGDETRRLESWTAFDEQGLGLSASNLDLSFSISPQRQPSPPSQSKPPPSSRRPQSHLLSISRPRTQPPPSTLRRPPPPPIEEFPSLEDAEDDPNFWTSTPAPVFRPGYLKTPSKRSVARAKRPGLPASPEKKFGLGVGLGAGTASAPPGIGRGYAVPGGGGLGAGIGVTSFERRLREGGFGRSVGAGEKERERDVGRGRARGRGKGRVGFGGLGDGLTL